MVTELASATVADKVVLLSVKAEVIKTEVVETNLVETQVPQQLAEPARDALPPERDASLLEDHVFSFADSNLSALEDDADPAERATDSEPAPSGSGANAISGLGQEHYAAWVALVDQIRSGRTDGMAELYHLFSKGIRFYLCRQLGTQELDDKVHDTFVVVVQAIRRGELREPERLMGFVRTIVRRQVAAHIDKVVHSRREQMDLDTTSKVADPRGNPEEEAIFHQRTALIQRVLQELPERDREILTRFYLNEQNQSDICSEMGLSQTQFRLLKSRAKNRFGELGKRKLAHGDLQAVFLRTSAGLSH